MSELSDTQPPAKKRKWPRRLLVTAIVLTILGFLINGPVARWAVQYSLDKGLETQGMTGAANVSGSLTSGFTISEINYNGELGIQKLKIASLSTNYTFLKILKGNINSVSLDNAEIILDVAKFPPSKEKPKDPDAKLRETLATIHNWVSKPEISIQNLDLTILQNDKRQARFKLGELNHPSATNNFKLTNFTAQDTTDRITPSQQVNITWTPETAKIDRFEVLPDVALAEVNIDWASDVKGNGILQFIDSTLNLSADETLTAKLTSGTVTTEQLKERFNLDLPVAFQVNGLDLKIDNWKDQPIPSWKIDGALAAKSFTYDVYNLTNATLKLDQSNANFDLTLQGTLNQTPANLTLDGTWNQPSTPDWWSDFTTDYTLKSPKLGNLVDLWWKAPDGLDLTPATIDAKGSFTLKNNNHIIATVQGQITELKAKSSTVPPLNIDSTYTSDKPLIAKITSVNRLALDATYNFDTSNYQGNLTITESNPAWISQLATIFNTDVKLEAPLNLSWSGSGNADIAKPQTGKLKVDELHITLPEKPQFHITTDAEYNWPESLNIKKLTARESDWLANASLVWDGKTINLPGITLDRGKTKIAAISGTIPFTSEINSAKTFLAQKAPINLSVKTTPLALQQIDEWLGLKAVNNVTGTAELDVSVSGSPHKPDLAGKFEALNIKGILENELKPIDIKLNFLTEEKRLKTTATILEANANRLTLNAALPYEPDTWLNDPNFLKKFLDSAPISADIKINTLPIERFSNFFPDNLKNLNGKIDADITLTGTPKNPSLKGNLAASNIRGFASDEVNALGFKANFLTENGQLKFDADINQGEENRINLVSSVPYEPSKWIEDPDYLNEFLETAKISADLKIKTLPLNRFKSFAPQLTKLDGTISGTGTLSGTFNDPKYKVELEANVPLIKLNISEIDEIRNVKLEAKFNEDRILLTKLNAQVNGGQFQADGNINLTDFASPSVDVDLKTRYALVHRDDLMSIRANTDLKVKGTLEDATISGTIGLAESLFYKDIELIPVGVPSSAAAKVVLPAADAEKLEDLPIPDPFGNWKLNLTIRTDDPVLIRGNVAKGNVSGSIKVGGTLKNPAPNGTLYLNEVRAKLPFSILEIPKGEIRFNPKDALNPTLEIRGKSTVGSYDVSLFVYGPATSPKTAFTSYPPLPESEVMALLGTGTTTSGLEDRDVATFKAFQLFLLKLKQRAEKPGGNKLFASLLSGVENLNLKVGESNQFTGTKYSSSTIEIDKNWHFTAQFDGQQNTRGLIVYVIRFR